MISPTTEEVTHRDQVSRRIITFIQTDATIKLPAFDPTRSIPSPEFALQSVAFEPNDFSGTVGQYVYQFEGEEDLLHLIVTRRSGESLTPEEAQRVAAFLLPNLPPALMWLRPGIYSQHFYFGHDELLRDR